MIRYTRWILLLLTIKVIEAYPQYPCDAECKEIRVWNQNYGNQRPSGRRGEPMPIWAVFLCVAVGTAIFAVFFRSCAIYYCDMTCCRRTDQFIAIESEQPKVVSDEWQKLRGKLHDEPACVVCTTLAFVMVVLHVTIPFGVPCGICNDEKRKKEELENRLNSYLQESPVGSWEEHKNMNLLKYVYPSGLPSGGGGVMLVHMDGHDEIAIDAGISKTVQIKRSKTPIEDLKRIVEQYNYSAITYYPVTRHAVLRKIHYRKLNARNCEKAEGYKCSTFIWNKKGDPSTKEKTPITEEPAKSNYWAKKSKDLEIQALSSSSSSSSSSSASFSAYQPKNNEPPAPPIHMPREMYQSFKKFEPVINNLQPAPPMPVPPQPQQEPAYQPKNNEPPAPPIHTPQEMYQSLKNFEPVINKIQPAPPMPVPPQPQQEPVYNINLSVSNTNLNLNQKDEFLKEKTDLEDKVKKLEWLKEKRALEERVKLLESEMKAYEEKKEPE